jgi:hypothetical protein
MSEERNVKVFESTPGGKGFLEKPRKRWIDGVENYLKKMGFRGWRKTTKNRDAWNLIQKEARVLHGQLRQWREIHSKSVNINRIKTLTLVLW